MPEERRPSDTVRIDRALIDEEMAKHKRQSSPPPAIQAAIAEAQMLDAETCPACGQGMVPSKIAARVRLALPAVPPPPDTQDTLDEEE